jgi:hypothetical protein
MSRNKVVDLRTKARPVRVREQHEIIEDRRKKRKEKIDAVNKKFEKGH